MGSVSIPGRHPAFHPIGRLRKNPFKGGKKNMSAPLNLTAMVDMFTVIVIFLLQSFSASGEIMFIQKGIKLPTATQAQPLEERGPVVTLFCGDKADPNAPCDNVVLIEGEKLAKLDELDDAEPGIPNLADRLKKIRENEERLVGRDPTKPFEQHAIVQSDKRIDFKLVRKTIFSVNEAGWTHLNFAAMPDASVSAAPLADGEAPAEE